MIQDLMLSITGTGGDDSALATAIALASTCDAQLSVVQPVDEPLPFVGPLGTPADFNYVGLRAQLRDEAAASAERFRARLAHQAIAWDVRLNDVRLADPPRAMARQARYSDLVVVAAPQPGADDGAIARAYFSALLFESGRPVLAVPHGHDAGPLHRVVVAWKPTRESTRALHDALPLLAKATSIDVVVVDPEVGDAGHGEDPGVDIATHLARHDLRVEVRSVPRAGRTVAAALLAHAAEAGAQLLVAGGYGHSRLREWALGGTTRELLHALHLPVLFSH
jgi:nucleotide-binding universal stress UspA family protein